jgi:hypothetical protein
MKHAVEASVNSVTRHDIRVVQSSCMYACDRMPHVLHTSQIMNFNKSNALVIPMEATVTSYCSV